MNGDNEKGLAILGGGCFWCLEPVFEALQGVERVEPGYSGGHTKNPSYREVCSGETGHAEAVRITFDPAVVSFPELLRVFFTIHDPTTPDRQGADVGTQYRSVIFHQSPEQKRMAEEVIAELEALELWNAPVVTQLVPAEAFYVAEAQHHDYYERNPDQAYCRIVIEPKIAKFRKKFVDRLKA